MEKDFDFDAFLAELQVLIDDTEAILSKTNTPVVEDRPAQAASNIVILPQSRQARNDSGEAALSPRKKTAGILFNVLFYIMLVAMIAGSTMFAFSNNESKSIFGYRFYTVLSDSMRPSFKKGDMIFVKLTDPDEIEIGDVITFNPGSTKNAYLTHRVVGFTDNRAGTPGNYIITRGDTNDTDDLPVASKMLIGKKVASVPKAGGVLQFIRNNFVLSLIILICFFASIFMFKWYFAKPPDEDAPGPENEDEPEPAFDSEIKNE